MSGLNFESDAKLRTIVRGVSRWGTLCGVFAMLVFVTGCPVVPTCTTDAGCDDGIDCTTDTCGADGVCANANNTNSCDDGDACTAPDVCADGACTAGSAVAGCCNSDADCATGETCTANACGGTCSADADCPDDGNLCTTAICLNGGCTFNNNAATCDDGNVCTDNDGCSGGACAGSAITGCCTVDADCAANQTCSTTTNLCVDECLVNADCPSDNDACTDETCTAGACVSSFNSSGCDDGLNCTTNDVCDGAGNCAGTTVTCPADQECNSANGNCEAIICTTNAQCDDGFSCTTDTCDVGPGTCLHTPIDAACNDGNFCSGTETCDTADADADVNGCLASGDPCSNPTPICNEATNACDACTDNADCNDEFSCTADTCTAGSCANTPDNLLCNDNLFCTVSDTCDTADPDADAAGCVNTGDPCDCADATLPCAPDTGDNLLCNEGADSCDDCVSNADCDDGITCTVDACNGVTGICTHAADDTACPDLNFCNGTDLCVPADVDADVSGCIPDLGTAPCLNACDENLETCFDCTSNSECDDGLPCTGDTCDGGTGLCTHADNCGVEFCNQISGACVECLVDADCAVGETCPDHVCVVP